MTCLPISFHYTPPRIARTCTNGFLSLHAVHLPRPLAPSRGRVSAHRAARRRGRAGAGAVKVGASGHLPGDG
uniref:Uncharacterized protein n=1 Tax=Arundo donax TaxID=35708 RepID=A0A0A9BGC9_ARUDO